jgi:hypothetical protein
MALAWLVHVCMDEVAVKYTQRTVLGAYKSRFNRYSSIGMHLLRHFMPFWLCASPVSWCAVVRPGSRGMSIDTSSLGLRRDQQLQRSLTKTMQYQASCPVPSHVMAHLSVRVDICAILLWKPYCACVMVCQQRFPTEQHVPRHVPPVP